MEEGNINKEIDGLKRDRYGYELEMQVHQMKLLENLKGEMGQDIKDVLSGKVKVKLPIWKRFRFKLQKIIEMIFELF